MRWHMGLCRDLYATSTVDYRPQRARGKGQGARSTGTAQSRIHRTQWRAIEIGDTMERPKDTVRISIGKVV
jgi:hypothetical protein